MTDPCYIGGEQSLQNNSAVLEELLDAKTFQAQRDKANEITAKLIEEIPAITADNVDEVFADMIARDLMMGGDGKAYESAMQNFKHTDASFEALRTIILQQKIYTRGMALSSTKMVGVAEQLTNAKAKGLSQKSIKELELKMVSAQAQLRNYMAHRSAIGTGLSFAFSQRRTANVADSLKDYTESYMKNYEDAFEGEKFLQGTERNIKTKERLERELKDLNEDADLADHVKAAEDTVKETKENLKSYKKTRTKKKPEDGDKADKLEADLEAKVKEAEQDVAQIKKINDLKAKIKTLKSEGAKKKTQAEIDKLKAEREELARRKIEASDITTEELYNDFLNQKLGSRSAVDFAKRITFAAKMGKEHDVLRQIENASKKTGFHKMLDMGLQWFTGSLLSGPPTFVLNAVTPILSRTLQQLEMATGALLSGNLPLARASLDMHNLFYGVSDAYKMGAASLKMDKDALLGGPRMFDEGDQVGAFAPTNFGKEGEMLHFLSSDPMKPVMNTMNFLTRLPNRLNGSADTFNKTMSVMKYLRTHFAAEALAKRLPYDEVQEYVRKNVQKMFNTDGSLFSEAGMTQSAVKQALDEGIDRTDPIKFEARVGSIMEEKLNEIGPDKASIDKLARRAEAFARESTFTDEAGAFTKLIKQGLNQMPIFKFIMPFVSTPMNILHFGWRRTAVGAVVDKFAPMLKKTKEQRMKEWKALSPMEKAAARGRYATAVATTGAMTYFAYNNSDRITGGGPRNRAERKALMETGWQPYSFVIQNEDGTKTYISYERVDPLATMISIVADVAEFAKMNPDLEGDASEMISALSFTIAENMTDKSFLRGLNNVINITQEPEVYLPKTVKDVAAAMAVPMFVDKIKNYEGEQMIRESRKLADAILRKVPIAEDRVPPKRTFLGEAMYKQNPLGALGIANPIYIKSTKNDLVDEKIQSLLHGFSMPSPNWTRSKETDMREFYNEDGRQAYDRMLELTSEHKIYGRTLRQSLRALFKSPAYRQAEQNYTLALENGDVSEDPRVRLTNKIISRYRRVAKRLVIQEFPELQQTVRGIQQRNYQARTGQPINPIPSL